MIIKSMSRKERSFADLVGYIERDHEDNPLDLYHNFFEQRRADVIAEFQANAEHLAARKNGNVMYHEVVSIQRQPGLDEETQKQMLRQLTEAYIAERAPACLVFGTLHDDTRHSLHYHLVISANAIGERKRHSLKKREFARIQRDIERQCNERFPELNQGRVMNTRSDGAVSEAGYQMYRRTGRLPRREALIARIAPVLAARDSSEAVAQLTAGELSFYTRGKHAGVVDLRTGRRHRLKTLGLRDEFDRFQAEIELGELQRDVAARLRDRPVAAESQLPEAAERQNETIGGDEGIRDAGPPLQMEPAEQIHVPTAEPDEAERHDIRPERIPAPEPDLPIAARSAASRQNDTPAPVQASQQQRSAPSKQPAARGQAVEPGRLRRQASLWGDELRRRSAMLADWRRRREDDYEDER